MERKGLSPLIAVIMLIAFTLIVGAVVASWATHFAQQLFEKDRCIDARVRLMGATYDSEADSLNLRIYNLGRVDLRFRAMLLYPGTQHIYDKTADVRAGQPVVFTMTSPYCWANCTTDSPVYANITDDLQQVLIESDECSPPCYQCYGARDLLLDIDITGL
jgi:flagellin-like protein